MKNNQLSLYLAARGQMRTGDLLQWKSNSLLGAAIRLKTQKDRREHEVENDINVNHSSLAICLTEKESGDLRMHTNEAMGGGTIPAFLSVRLQQYNGSVWWYPLSDELDEQRIGIGRRAFENLGIGYDYWAIAKQLFGIHPKIDGSRLYCNEYCCVCWGIKGATAKSPNWLPNLGIFKEPVRII